MEWISVKDKLPEKFQDVLAYARSQDNNFFSVVHCQYFDEPTTYGPPSNPFAIKLFCEGSHYVRFDYPMIGNPGGNGYFYFGEVTHWLPLPELPKEELLHEDIEETK